MPSLGSSILKIKRINSFGSVMGPPNFSGSTSKIDFIITAMLFTMARIYVIT